MADEAVLRRVGEDEEVELGARGTLAPMLRLIEQGGTYRLSGISMGMIQQQSAVFSPVDGTLQVSAPHLFGPGVDVRIHDVNVGEALEADDVRTERGVFVAAADALAPDASPALARALVEDLVALDRINDAYADGRTPDESLSVAMNRLNRRMIEAGLDPLLPVGDSGDIVMSYSIGTLPAELGDRNPMQADSNRNDFTYWRYRSTIERLPESLQQRLGRTLVSRTLDRASVADLDQIDRFPGRTVEHGVAIDRLIELCDAGLQIASLPPGVPTLGKSLEDLAARVPTASTETDFKNLARINLDVAGHLLYGAPDVVADRELLRLFRWVNASDIRQLGWRESESVRPRQDDSAYTQDLGPLGGMSRQEFDFARAWLNSTREQRLDHLGLDETRWAPAERFLGDAIVAIARARFEEKDKFGIDDLVLTGIAIGFAWATGGAATSWLGGALGGGTLTVAATVTVPLPLTTAQLALAAAGGAAVSAFTSTLILTRGDLDAAIEAGAIGALSGGLSEYVATLDGTSRVVANAIIRGAEAELSGEEFADGVLAALGDRIGEGTKAYLRANMGEFVAGFVGQVTASAISHHGDIGRVSEDALAFIGEFASGRIRSWFTGTVGEEYRFLSNATESLVSTYIRSGGDLSAVRRLLDEPGFVQGLAGDLGADVTAMLGGEENFKGLLIGGMTRLIAQGAFDPKTLEANLQGYALSLAGHVAGQRVGGNVDARIGREDTLLGTVLGKFTDIMVAADGDPAAIAVGVYGQFMNGLADLGAGALPEKLGGADGFLADLIRQFGESYEMSGGNLDLVARDLVALAAEAGVDEALVALRNGEGGVAPARDNPGIEATLAFIRAVLDGTAEPIAAKVASAAPGGLLRRPSVHDIMGQLGTHDPAERARIIDRLTDTELDDWVERLNAQDPDTLLPQLRVVAEDFSGERLNRFYDLMDPELRTFYIDSVNRHGSDAAQERLVELVQREALDRRLLDGSALGPADRELMLDVGQIALDVLGIFDPSPTSDGLNLGISLLRGNWLDAGISLVGMVPYIGDLAKAGKLGGWAVTIERVIDKAVTDSRFRAAVLPALDSIAAAISAAPAAVLGRLPEGVATKLGRIRDAVAGLEGRAVAATGRLTTRSASYGDNQVTWWLDAQGRPVRARAQLSEANAPTDRPGGESTNQGVAGGSDRLTTDQGGHLVGHRFIADTGDMANLFPQNANLNMGAYKKLENELAAWIEAGAKVEFDVSLVYGNDNLRPDRIETTYRVLHPETGAELYRRPSSFRNGMNQTFQRHDAAFIAGITQRIRAR